MRFTLRTAFATVALCFAGCATTAGQPVAMHNFHGPSAMRQQPTLAMTTTARTSAPSSESPTADERAGSGRVIDRGIPMPEPAREAFHALPTPQVPIPFQPAERPMPSYMGGRSGGNAAYWQ